MMLREIAHARAGDKGDTSDITVVAIDDDAYAVLDRTLTADMVRDFFADLPIRRVDRYEVPGLIAFKFVLRGALVGGVTHTLALDAHGKCLASCLLGIDLTRGQERA